MAPHEVSHRPNPCVRRLLSSRKFIRCRLLEECDPGLHRFLGNEETAPQLLLISLLKSPQQLALCHILKVYLASGPKSLRAQPILFALFSRPKAKVENNIHSQFQRSARNLPKNRLKQTVTSIVLWFVSILTKKADVPLIRCQSKRGQFTFKSFGKRRLPRTGKPNHQVESGHASC